MTSIWQSLLSRFDQWGAVREWRRRVALRVIAQKPTYDVYPDAHDDPEVKVYLEARDARGRLLREYVYLEGFSLHQINLQWGAKRGDRLVGEWVWDAIIESMVRMAIRLEEARKEKEARHASSDVPKA